jgi:hypothetical protein
MERYTSKRDVNQSKKETKMKAFKRRSTSYLQWMANVIRSEHYTSAETIDVANKLNQTKR